MTSDDPKTTLLDALDASLAAGRFVKLTLGKGKDRWRQAFIRLIEIQKQPHLTILLRRDGAADATENHPIAAARAVVQDLLESRFENAHLFTTTEDIELRTNRKGEPRLARHAPTFQTTGPTEHNRQKNYVLDPKQAPYLHALGVTTAEGQIKADKADKYRQLQNLIKILDDRVAQSELPEKPGPRIVDMGCGKGYLTFALYDYFRNHLNKEPEVIGVDRNRDLVDTCNKIAAKLGMTGLRFECGDVDSFEPGAIDLLIALHACDTATDTAIYKGIRGNAAIIMAVPCCQKELRPQFKVSPGEQPIFKHDTFKDRFSQTLTDALRGLLMESQGYKTRIMEFISDAHTHRNVIILGVHAAGNVVREARLAEVAALKGRYGIERQHLEVLLNNG